LRQQEGSPLSYAPVGISRGSPAGYDLDEHCLTIGQGERVFERAKSALDAWVMFRLGWVELHPARAPTTPGTTVAILVRYLGCWSLHACRVVERLPTFAGPPRPWVRLRHVARACRARRGAVRRRARCGRRVGMVSNPGGVTAVHGGCPARISAGPTAPAPVPAGLGSRDAGRGGRLIAGSPSR